MQSDNFSIDISNHIAHVRFSRPDKFNSFTPDFWRDFPLAIDEISNEGHARVIVLSAEGKHFTAGMDIAVFMQGGLDPRTQNREVAAEAFRYHIKSLQETFNALENARQPVLAAIQGGAVGAGVDLISACDCRYASADAFFCIQETAIGMTADVGTYPRLTKLIPEGWARQMSYTAARLPAHKAKEIGLVNEVYDNADIMLESVLEIAGSIAQHSPLAVTGCKKLHNYSRDHSINDTLDYISLWNSAMLRPDDIKESYIAKTEKRAPQFDSLLSLQNHEK